MKPTFSIIVFTVASGAGLGMFALFALLDVAAPFDATQSRSLHAALFAYALVVAGLCASTLHLANPRNAWRSLTRFRTSWLSREAVFALVFLVVALIEIAMLAIGTRTPLRVAVALLTLMLAWAVLISTAMIYASLKPIRQWHTHWTTVNYVVLGHWSGGVMLLAWLPEIDALRTAVAGLGVVAAITKLIYWRAIDGGVGSMTLEHAIGVDRGVRPAAASGTPSIMRARLFDVGHTHGTFLTDEFGFVVARRHRTVLRTVFWIFAIALPLISIVVGSRDGLAGSLAAAACVIGLLAERWLFFADARHTVRLYHGDART